MLNCCIERKRARDDSRQKSGSPEGARERKVSGQENGRLATTTEGSRSLSPGPATAEVSPGKSWESWSDSEDEFFECLSDTEELKETSGEGAKEAGKAKPEGRLQPHGKLTLLNSEEPLYIPVTQVTNQIDQSVNQSVHQSVDQ